MSQNTSDTISASYLGRILDSVHPLMAEGLYLAAVPNWFDHDLFKSMRDRVDGREEGLILRLNRYSFVVTLEVEVEGNLTYAVRHEERVFLQRRWIAEDPEAYCAAHQRVLDYLSEHPDPNPFAQAQNRLYHQLFVDVQTGMDYLVDRFRAYHNERHLSAIDRLLVTVNEARFYLVMLDAQAVSELDDLLTHLQARLAQLRGRWSQSLDALRTLRQKSDLAPWLSAYVARAYGYALAHTGQYVEAIEQYRFAQELFEQGAATVTGAAGLQAERAHTLIVMGQAHVGLAMEVRGYHDTVTVEETHPLGGLRNFFYFFLSLPLVVYLSFYLGGRVWHPRFWPTLRRLDWIVARLFATGAHLYAKADPILERHGTPSEGVLADEQLAHLYLAMDDVEQARWSFAKLLTANEAPLGEYRRASIRVGLGSTLVRLGQHIAAREQLEEALLVLSLYEDVELLANAQKYLAEAMLGTGELDSAGRHFERSLQAFQAQGNEIMSTELAERLEQLGRELSASPDLQAGMVRAAGDVRQRRYSVPYRHPATIFFQRATIGSLVVIAFLILVSAIRMDTGIAVAPEISFNATPLLRSDAPDFTPILSQGVVALSLSATPSPRLLAWLGMLLLLVYLVLSTSVGIAAIVKTSLAKVQATARAQVVRFDGNCVQVGEGDTRQEMILDDVERCYRADLRFFEDLMIDDSGTTLIGADQRLSIRGSTAWYSALRDRIVEHLPLSAQQRDFSYSLLRSRMGILYLVTIGILVTLSLVGQFASPVVTLDTPGLPYSLADLYPFLYLGLFLPPVWWFIFRPLRIRLHSDPLSKFPWWVGGVGLLLAVFRTITRFRPWLTIPDIYVSLFIVCLVGGSGVVIWLTRTLDLARPLYARWLRMAVGIVVAVVTLVMGLYLWREATSYHFTVLGDAWRDSALRQNNPAAQERDLVRARRAYDRAVAIAETDVVTIDGRLAVDVPLGIPRVEQFTWVVAQNNRAATASLLGDYAAAINDYTELLDRVGESAQRYADRAVAYQGLGTVPGDSMGTVEVARRSFNAALADFGRAISLDPQNAPLYLWRGITHQALGASEKALADYDRALATPGDKALDVHQTAKAWTGKAWIAYSEADYLEAVDLFQEANALTPDASEALLGLGYAYYSLRQYDEALATWTNAADLNPSDPIAYISLGTLYWRVATVGDDYNASGTDRCSSSTLTEAEKDKTAAQLEQSLASLRRSTEIPGQDPEDLAFTFRTMAQVQFLLRNCPGYDSVQTLTDSVGHYTEAIRLDPDNAVYWHIRGRLAYAIWLNSSTGDPSAREWLFMALEDTDMALQLDPVDQGDYRPNVWRSIIWREAVIGSLEQGDSHFADGAYESALALYELVAEREPDQAQAAFKAGLAALALGQQKKASVWYQEGIERALGHDSPAEVQEAYLALQALAKSIDGLQTSAVETLFVASGVDLERPYQADDAFDLGLEALRDRRVDDAVEYYERGLELAIGDGDIAVVSRAIVALQTSEGADEITPQFQQALTQLEEVAARHDTAVEDAFKLALIAATVGDDATAGKWYNEGVRRSALNNNYPPIRTSRADLKELWAAQGVNSDSLLVQMETQLRTQLSAHPELLENALYWRFRAWFKYGLGLSAFRLGDETAARAALRSAQADAERAFELDRIGNTYVRTYLIEGAWGWYHVERGDDAYAMQKLQDALADYEAATRLIMPAVNADARNELVIAAFKAGLTALLLGDSDRALVWYGEGIAYYRQYNSDESVLTNAIGDLNDVLAVNPGLVSIGETILEDLEGAR